MTGYYINGKRADQRSFSDLRDQLEQILHTKHRIGRSSTQHADPFADNNITHNEISEFLNVDESKFKGHANVYEISDVVSIRDLLGVSKFMGLKNCLKRHGFNIYKEIDDQDFRKIIDRVGLGAPGRQGRLPSKLRPFLEDRDFVLAAVKINGLVMQQLDGFRDDPEIAFWAAVSSSGIIIPLLDPKISGDRDFILSVVHYKGEALLYTKPEFKNDPEIVTEAVSSNGLALRYANPRFQIIRPTVRLAVISNEHAYNYIHTSLKQDTEFLASLAMDNFNLLEVIPAGRREDVWRKMLPMITKVAPDLPHDACANYQKFKRFFREKISKKPRRFRSFHVINEIYKNNTTLDNPQDSRPLALIVGSTSDWNNTMGRFPLIDKLTESGRFRVVYMETPVDSLLEIYSTASSNGRFPIHSRIFMGHGDEESIELKGFEFTRGSTFSDDEKNSIDTSDFESGQFNDLNRYTDPNGQILLMGCYNGYRGAHYPNLANIWKRHVPRTTRIYASQISAGIFNFEVKNDLSFDIGFRENRPYVTHGRR